MPSTLHLKVKPPSGAPFLVPIEAAPIRIGRSTLSEIQLDDPFASRLHAEVRPGLDGPSISDLGSGNGTFVNGRRIGAKTPLSAGDRVQIGNTLLEVEDGEGGDEDADDEAVAAPPEQADARPADPPASSGAGEPAGPDFVARPEATRRESTVASRLPHLGSVVAAVREAATGERDPVARRQDLFGVISRMGAALLSPADLAEALHQVLDMIFEAVEAERAYLLLRRAGDGELVCKLASFRRGRSRGKGTEAHISGTIIAEVVGNGRPVLASDALADERFKNRQSILMSRVRSVMAAPLAIEDRVLGMIYVDSPAAANVFGEDDLRMLTTIAGIAAIKIENAVLLEQRLETERLRQQLASAREIQARLLPRLAPALPGYELSGDSSPSGEVGGDYFDFIELPDGRLLLALGDVSGKGLDAALLMSSVHASVRAQASNGLPLAELVARVSRFLHGSSPANRFVTLFVAALDRERHRLAYVNAGHNPPLLVRAGGGGEELPAGGIPAGMRAEAAYEEGGVDLAPGDVLLAYSDGISEAGNAAGEEFTAERLGEVARRYQGALASELHELIDQELAAFAAGAPQTDDRTLIVLRRSA